MPKAESKESELDGRSADAAQKVRAERDPGDLTSSPREAEENPAFISQIEKNLEETKEAVLSLADSLGIPKEAATWDKAKEIVSEFKPVPWFIWRLSNYVFSKPGQTNPINEGLVLGLRRLLFAAASDDVLGTGEKVNDVRKALKILPSDVAAATAVIHSICRRFRGRPFERIWAPIVDDAIVRARIGWEVGRYSAEFGPGRCMLAGFSGRCGLAILLASGTLTEAQKTLELLAGGAEIPEAGLKIYRCEPLKVSALALSAAGCGREAAFGTVSYAVPESKRAPASKTQEEWLAAFAVCEALRLGRADGLPKRYWDALKIDQTAQGELSALSRKIVRRGHGWTWLT